MSHSRRNIRRRRGIFQAQTWNGAVEGVHSVPVVLHDVGRLPGVRQQEAGEHDDGEGDLHQQKGGGDEEEEEEEAEDLPVNPPKKTTKKS